MLDDPEKTINSICIDFRKSPIQLGITPRDKLLFRAIPAGDADLLAKGLAASACCSSHSCLGAIAESALSSNVPYWSEPSSGNIIYAEESDGSVLIQAATLNKLIEILTQEKTHGYTSCDSR